MNLTEIMCHPWTTKNGTYDIIIEEGTAAFNLAELTRKAVVKEIALLLSDFPRKEYREGEYLFMAGFPAEEMFYIEEGQVDIVLRAQDREWLQQGEEGGLGKADIHSDSDESDETDSEEEEDDLPNEQEDGIVNPGEHSKLSGATKGPCCPLGRALHLIDLGCQLLPIQRLVEKSAPVSYLSVQYWEHCRIRLAGALWESPCAQPDLQPFCPRRDQACMGCFKVFDQHISDCEERQQQSTPPHVQSSGPGRRGGAANQARWGVCWCVGFTRLAGT